MSSLIDVHCHIVPETLPAPPPSGHGGRWPCFVCEDGHRTMMIGGKAFRRFDDRNWSVTRRVEYMDAHGIALQVLSPLPELLSYWFDAAACAEMCRHVNGAILEMIGAARGRFAGLAMVPLQAPDRAIAELRRIRADGFAGVEIASNVDGVSPADVRFHDFFAAAQELELAIFVHGYRPAGTERLLGHPAMGAIAGVPMDTAMCLASMLAQDFPQRFPRLRIAFSHGGGAIGAVLPRFQHVWNVMPDLRCTMREPLTAARKFYYDVLTFSADYVLYLAGLFGADRLFVGTDFPAGGMGLMEPETFVASLPLSAPDREAIRAGNARRYLNLVSDG